MPERDALHAAKGEHAMRSVSLASLPDGRPNREVRGNPCPASILYRRNVASNKISVNFLDFRRGVESAAIDGIAPREAEAGVATRFRGKDRKNIVERNSSRQGADGPWKRPRLG